MKIKYLLTAFLLLACANTHAEWFLRGTQNGWGTTQMSVGGTNTMEMKNVIFTSAGSVKFDRFGDWKENYGINGLNGGNIPVAAGRWNIKFYTDTKNWKISRVVDYHLRGTHNKWAEGDLLTPVAGSSINYEICRDFGVGTTANIPRFKIDPNGGWGTDSFPAQDYIVSGWTKIIIDGDSRKIVSATTKLGENCMAVQSAFAFTNPGPINLPVLGTFDNPIKGTNLGAITYTATNGARMNGSSVFISNPGTTIVTATEESVAPCFCGRVATYTIFTMH